MYLIVYKTTHINGKYYIGRHQTDNIDDGYLGSGKWIRGIKDKTCLSREVIAEATSFEHLCELEEYHISLHHGKPNCMNFIKGSDGLTSDDATELNRKRVNNGTHHFLGGEISRAINKKRVEDGTNALLGGEISRAINKKRVEDGTHNLLGGELQKQTSRKLIEAGTHNLLGPASNQKMLDAGTHPSQHKWTCNHCNKSGRGKSNFTMYHGDNCKSRSDSTRTS